MYIKLMDSSLPAPGSGFALRGGTRPGNGAAGNAAGMLFERVLVHRGGRPRRIPDERGTAEGVQGKEAGRYETPLAAWQKQITYRRKKKASLVSPHYGGYSLTDGQNTQRTVWELYPVSRAGMAKDHFRQWFAVCSSLDKTGCITKSAAASPFARSPVI